MNVWKRWLRRDSSWEDYECDFREIGSKIGLDEQENMRMFCETNVDKFVESVTHWVREMNRRCMEERLQQNERGMC